MPIYSKVHFCRLQPNEQQKRKVIFLKKTKIIIAAVLIALALIIITVTVAHFNSAKNKAPEAEAPSAQIEFSVTFENVGQNTRQ